MDLQPLLSSRGDDEPSGENLEYDMDFISLDLAAQPGEEVQKGDEILPAEDPDWADVKEKALAVLERSHDLRAAVHLAQAVLYIDGLQGFAETTGYIRGLVEQHWDTFHPMLDADDDNDPTARVNAAQNLAGAQSVIRALRRTPLADSRGFGRASLRDIQSASGEIPMKDGPDSGQISAAFQDTDPALLAARLAAAREAQANVIAIDKAFGDQLPGQGPDFDDLIKTLKLVTKTLADKAGGDEDDAGGAGDEAGAGDSGGDAGGAPAGGGVGGSGAINSLRDVHAAIDRIMAFYAKQEPSSPVPVLMTRAKKLVGADFMTIMKDMAPKGLDNVKLIGGLEQDD
jgi:type VI secretion system protein ImpA